MEHRINFYREQFSPIFDECDTVILPNNGRFEIGDTILFRELSDEGYRTGRVCEREVINIASETEENGTIVLSVRPVIHWIEVPRIFPWNK